MNEKPNQNSLIPRYSIFLISAIALCYEILLMRLFSIVQWHHFAYMIISLALLGYGASGTFLAIFRNSLFKQFSPAFIANLSLFSLSIVVCYLIAQHIPFNPEQVIWDIRQPFQLLAIYLLLSLPFFFAANCIGLALSKFKTGISKIYAADLLGAGLGSLGIIFILFMVFPGTALRILGTSGLVSAAVAWWELRLKPRFWMGGFLVFSAFIQVLPDSWTELNVSPYKGLPETLQITGTRVIKQRSSPLGLLSVVKSPVIPFRYAPGLSLNATTEPPDQIGVFTDADAMTVITHDTGERKRLAFLDQLSSALPYYLIEPHRVLVLGAGGGSEVQQARYFNAQRTDAVELNPQMTELVGRDYADFAGHLYSRTGIHLYTAEARGFVSGSQARYDLIQMALLDSFSASSSGLYALNESYLYTVEAMQEYLRHLAPDGILAFTRWIKLPPRDTLKLFYTAIQALQHLQQENPDRRLILIRGWQTSTLLVKNGFFTDDDIETLLHFCRNRSFDVAYYPGMPVTQANRYNILDQPYFYSGAMALLGKNSKDYVQQYKFNLQPATDDKPYFFNFFKWRALPEIITLRGEGGVPLLEWGYLILVGTLLQAVLVSLALILFPLLFYRREYGDPATVKIRIKALIYFTALGLAFLFLEIAFIQKFILFLHHPLYATSVVLAAFLIFAGLGSTFSKRFTQNNRYLTGAKWAITGIVAIGILYSFGLDKFFTALLSLPIPYKIVISILLIAPLAFCMGMPYPLGLTQLGERNAAFIPWVWGVNGCASVISAVLATLLAIHFGFTMVVTSALTLYIFALIFFPKSLPSR